MRKFDDAELAVMQWEYEKTPLTLVQIGLRHGTSAQTVCKLARRLNWQMRSGRKAAAAAPATPAVHTAPDGAASAPPTVTMSGAPPPAGEVGLTERLRNLISMKLDQMETMMESGELNSADLERDAKSVTALIGSTLKAPYVPGEDNEGMPDVARSTPAAGTDEVERLQREIIERFERILRRRQSQSGSH